MPKAPEPSSTCQKTTKSLPRISPKSYCYNAVPNRFLAHFSTSRANGPRSLSRVKVGTHSAFGEGSHTAACTPKQGAFRMGVVSLPSDRSARSQTSPGRVSERHTLPLWGLGRGCSQRTQGASGQRCAYARRCSEGVAAPLGCVIFFASAEIATCTHCSKYFFRFSKRSSLCCSCASLVSARSFSARSCSRVEVDYVGNFQFVTIHLETQKHPAPCVL